MSEMTEHHHADHVPSLVTVGYTVEESVLNDVAEAIAIGAGKYQEPLSARLRHDRPLEYYWGAFNRHLAKARRGVIYDERDGHKHIAALIVRLFQIGAKLNEENDPSVEGFGVA